MRVKPFFVISFGELLWDLLPGTKLLGGAPANYAAQLQALGAQTALVSCLGADNLGNEALSLLASKGVNIRFLRRTVDYSTGTVTVSFAPTGEPQYLVPAQSAWDYIEPSAALLAAAAKADLIYFGTLAQRSFCSRQALEAILNAASSAVKFLDVNLRPGCWDRAILEQAIAAADILKVNAAEAAVIKAVFRMNVDSLSRFCEEAASLFSLRAAVVTMGEEGAIAADAKGPAIYQPGFQAQVADTIGAGDAFSAGFSFEFLRGADLQQCCRTGALLGAAACRNKGGMSPVRSFVLEQLSDSGARTARSDWRAAFLLEQQHGIDGHFRGRVPPAF